MVFSGSMPGAGAVSLIRKRSLVRDQAYFSYPAHVEDTRTPRIGPLAGSGPLRERSEDEVRVYEHECAGNEREGG